MQNEPIIRHRKRKLSWWRIALAIPVGTLLGVLVADILGII